MASKQQAAEESVINERTGFPIQLASGSEDRESLIDPRPRWLACQAARLRGETRTWQKASNSSANRTKSGGRQHPRCKQRASEFSRTRKKGALRPLWFPCPHDTQATPCHFQLSATRQALRSFHRTDTPHPIYTPTGKLSPARWGLCASSSGYVA